ncbi:MAG: UDP-2,3-diacylglucosamine diphosphatase LpxI [Candidatus Omnitrophota bacterium]
MAAMENIDRIALIAGNRNFPILLAKAARANGVEVIAIAVNSETEKEIETVANKVYWINLGEGKKLIEIINKEDIKYAVMAGKITKTTIIRESLRLDEEAKKLIGRVVDRRDDTLLSAIANRLKEEGVEFIDSTTFMKGMMPSKGVLTKRRPDRDELADIDFGLKIARELGRLDIGQSVAVKKKAIIAVEAIEGTDEMIKRAGTLAGEGIIVVKVSKPNQDMRFDVPVIGLTTIGSLKDSKAGVLGIEAEKVLVLEKDEVIREADKLGLCIVAV